MRNRYAIVPRYVWLAFVPLALIVSAFTGAIFVKEWVDDSFGAAARTAGPWFGGLIGLVIALLTAMYVSATQEMARSTAQLADETRRTREELSAPIVLPYFSFDRWLLIISVENIGAGVPKDVRVAFEPPIPSSRGDITCLPVNDKPIPELRPHDPFRHFVDVAPSFFSKDSPKPKQYVATVSYESQGQRLTREHPLDLSVYEGMRLADEKGMTDLVKHVERIARILERITDLSGLKIKTPRDIRREWQQWREEIAEQEREELASRADQQNSNAFEVNIG